MGVIAFLVRSELRRRWRTYGALALLLGIVAGAAMAASAGARRTASSFDRLLDATYAEDVLVNPDDGFTDFDAIEALPQVADACRASGAFAALEGRDGEPDFSTPSLALVTDGRCLLSFSGPARVEGRLPHPHEPYETFLSQQLADSLGKRPGDTLPLLVLADQGMAPRRVELLITGTGVFGQDALKDPDNEATFPVIVLTPTFGERHPVDPNETFTASLVRLRGGEADLAAFNAAAVETAGESLHLEDRWGNQRNAALSLEPYELALWLFAVAVVFAGGGMLVGAMIRSLAGLRATERALSSLGVPPSTRRSVPLLLALGTGAAAVVVGTVLATAMSVVLPIGPAHDIEPDPGIAVDGAVMLVGAAACLAVACTAGLVVAASLSREDWRARVPGTTLLGRIRLALPSPAAAGIRLATGELGASRPAARSTIAGAALGVAAVLTVLVVGAGLTRVIETPARYGWTWDATVAVFEEDMDAYADPAGGPSMRSLSATLERIGVDRWTRVSYGQLDVAGETVAAVGLGDHEGPLLGPALTEGRLPAAEDEIVLGSTTLARVGTAIGETVEAGFGTARREVRVVGRAVFPRLTEYPGAPKTGLGTGAIVSATTLSDLTGALPYAAVLIEGDEPSIEALRSLVPVGNALDVDAPIVMIERPQRPDALFGYDSTSTVQRLLAYLLVGLTLASVTLGLTAGARAARRELAVLRTLGFTRRQARGVIHVHGAVVGVAALLIGVPSGLTAGRLGWRAFAEHLGVGTDAVTPSGQVLVVALLALTACLLLTIPTASAVARRAPAEILRAE